MDKKLEVEKWITVKGHHIPVFKGETVADALSRRYSKKEYKQVGAGDGRRYRMPDLKNKDQVYNFYKEKFTICSSHYRNDIARELGITGTPQEKIDQIAKHFTKKWEQEQSINNDQDQKEKQIANNQEQAKQAATQKEAPKPDNKVEFHQVRDFDFEHLPRNFENNNEKQKLVIYRDQNGNELSCTRSFHGGRYQFRLTDDMGDDIIAPKTLTYDAGYARADIGRMLKEGSDKLKQRAEYDSKEHKIDDPFKGALGERKEISDPVNRIKELKEGKIINPHFDDKPQPKGQNYHNNCARCTATTFMQLKGYDVEAMTQKDGWIEARSLFKVDLTNPDNVIFPSSVSSFGSDRGAFRLSLLTKLKKENPNVYGAKFESLLDAEMKKYTMPKGPERAAKAIEDRVKSWGNGAYGELSVTWAGRSSSHSLVIYNDNGSVVIFDSQDASRYKTTDLTALMKRCKANNTQLMRFDNAEFKPGIESRVEKGFIVRNKK